MRKAAVLTTLASTLALGGCVSDTTVSGHAGAELAQGLTVLEVGEGALSIAYRRDDLVIYAEALRGPQTPDMYQQDPEAPRFEIDVRYLSDGGDAFFTRRGGDDWVEPAWGEALERQTANGPATDANPEMFELAGEIAALLRGEVARQIGDAEAAALEPEMEALLEFADQAPVLYEEHLAQARQRQVTPLLPDDGGDVTYGSDLGGPDADNTGFGAGYYYIAVHDASTAVIARHSATALYSWTGNGWLHVHNSCNHGRCGTEMGQKCLLQYYEAVQDYHPSWSLTNCATPYDAFSNDGHNCHDDTRVQLNNFVYGSYNNGYQYWCADGDNDTDFSSWPGDQSGSPECNARRAEGYNHPYRCQYNFTSSCPSSYQGTGDGCDCGCVFPDGTGADPDCRY